LVFGIAKEAKRQIMILSKLSIQAYPSGKQINWGHAKDNAAIPNPK